MKRHSLFQLLKDLTHKYVFPSMSVISPHSFLKWMLHYHTRNFRSYLYAFSWIPFSWYPIMDAELQELSNPILYKSWGDAFYTVSDLLPLMSSRYCPFPILFLETKALPNNLSPRHCLSVFKSIHYFTPACNKFHSHNLGRFWWSRRNTSALKAKLSSSMLHVELLG